MLFRRRRLDKGRGRDNARVKRQTILSTSAHTHTHTHARAQLYYNNRVRIEPRRIKVTSGREQTSTPSISNLFLNPVKDTDDARGYTPVHV